MNISFPKWRHIVFDTLAALALVYGFLAGLRTVADFDLGWQLATGRYVFQHGVIPRTDVFSYTAAGTEWIYPPFSGVLLFPAHSLGGWAALSWLGAVACCATIALLLRRKDFITAALAVIAVPVIAQSTTPRAELFTTVFFAAFLAILWRHFVGEQVALWLLPLLMVAWVNMHLGFIAGLAMLGAYVALELLETPFPGRRLAAWTRLRRAAPWLLATAFATLANPWGPRIYVAIARQEQSMRELGGLINWWLKPTLSVAGLRQAFNWHDPNSGYWWLGALAIVAVGYSVWQRKFGVAVVLAGAAYISLTRLRYQGLFACLAVVMGGATLSRVTLPAWWARIRDRIDHRLGKGSLGLRGIARLALLAGIFLLTLVRGADLVWNHYYLSAGQLSLFGSGISWWYPERATAFLLRERLPRNVFNDYNSGGYLTWRIGPEYPVYVDGRLIPFGSDFFNRYRRLLQEPLDSADWQQEADLRNINTVMLSVARYGGLGSFPLQQYCRCQTWRPVYLDEVAAIFVRNTPENAAWVNRLGIDCATVRIESPPSAAPASRARQNGELYNFYANSGSVFYVLGRGAEAMDDLESAEGIFPDDANLHLTKGQLFQSNGTFDLAEKEYLAALRLRATDTGWFLLGRLHAERGRYTDAADAFARAADISPQPWERWVDLGETCLLLQRPGDALKAFGRAERLSPYASTSTEGARFYARVAAGHARAFLVEGDVDRAIEFQKRAVGFAPRDPGRWSQLAKLYKAGGLTEQAQKAEAHAAELSSN